jgi:hypothetical protein
MPGYQATEDRVRANAMLKPWEIKNFSFQGGLAK